MLDLGDVPDLLDLGDPATCPNLLEVGLLEVDLLAKIDPLAEGRPRSPKRAVDLELEARR